jgi:hypothetical protein
LSSKRLFLLDHGLDAVVHVLNQLDRASAESSLVGDVVDVVVGLSMLSMGTSDLDMILVSDCLEIFLL